MSAADVFENRARWSVLVGDCRASLASLPDACVQACVTSPPYWGLRDYGVDGQIGREASPEAFVASLVGVFREVRRVLRDDGTLWVNIGDSYAGQPGGGQGKNGQRATRRFTAHSDMPKRVLGLKPKDLVGVPWMLAFALRADGWYLRSEIIWAKPNPMPESVTDRPTKAHEQVFLLAKSERYFYDAAAIAEPSTQRAPGNTGPHKYAAQHARGHEEHRTAAGLERIRGAQPTRNKRDVWTVASEPYDGAHFAVMPPALVTPCVLAGSRPGDVVLDPFGGSGTVGAVALGRQRRALLCELNPAYAELARARCRDAAGPLFAKVPA